MIFRGCVKRYATEVNNILDVIARLYGYAGSLFNILEKNSINSLCLCGKIFVFTQSLKPLSLFYFSTNLMDGRFFEKGLR